MSEAVVTKPLIVGISGASGALYAIRLLLALQDIQEIETHLVISPAGEQIVKYEGLMKLDEVVALADFNYSPDDFFAPLASGSFRSAGMVIVPCSMKRLSAIANSYSDDLMGRAADVMLKERRRLVLLVRETPLHSGHLELMLKVSRLGGVIMPPVPALYQKPTTIVEMADQIVGRILSLFDITTRLYQPWGVKE